MRELLPPRLINALPDTVSAAFFASVWTAPRWLGEQAVANGMLIMLVEFVLVHASALIGTIVYGSGSRRGRVIAVLGGAAFYLLFIAAFAFSFKAWWPFLAFGWLLLGKLVAVIDRQRPSAATATAVQRDWVLSAVAYLGGVFLTVMLPVPRFGITADVVADLHLSGSGLWVEQPQTVIAFGTLYFGFLAWTKWRFPPAAAASTQQL